MPEDGIADGDDAEERLIAIFENLGWSPQGKENLDIPCTSGIHRERNRDHGVDGYMTYEDPFRSNERGVFIESKFSQWKGVNTSNLKDHMKQILGTMECAPEAEEFQTRFNFEEDRNWDAGILGVWADEPDDEDDDGYSHSDFMSYVSEMNVKGKERGTYEIAILGNHELNRLAHLSNQYDKLRNEYDEENEKLNFYYPSKSGKPVPTRQNGLSLEYILSDMVFAQLERPHTVNGEITRYDKYSIVFYFGTVSVDALKIMFKSLVKYNMLEAEEVWFYYDMMCHEGDMQDLKSAETQFKRNVIPAEDESSEENIPEFDFRRMAEMSYDSYTDTLRGE